MKALKGTVARVTGASRGVGRAIAERYGRLGANVVVSYVSSAKGAEECVAAIEFAGGKAIAVNTDLASVAEIEALFVQARGAFGKVDIVVANAGVEIVGDVADAAEYLAGPLAKFVSGQHLLLAGGGPA